MRAPTPLLMLLTLSACGERPVRDAGDAAALDAGAFDAVGRDAGAELGTTDLGGDGGRIPTTLTAAGRCTPFSTGRWCEGDAVRICGTRSGEAEPTTVRCGAGERCVMVGDRGACEPVGACAEGASRCESNQALSRCVGGTWVTSMCPVRCVGDALEAACADPGTTRPLVGTLRYSRKLIATNLLSWGDPVERPARRFAMRYRRGDAVLARAETDAEGRFSLDAPAEAMPGDLVEAVAALGAGGRVRLMVGDPGLPAGTYRTYGDDTSRGAAWTWRWERPVDGATLSIPLENAPAASVFDDLAQGAAVVQPLFRGQPGRGEPRYALAVWVKRGVQWDCGACYSELLPVSVQGQRFDGQLWLTGDAHENWWSPAVTLHEFGHWVMSAWGTIPHEGGEHFLGVPTFPGLAWSEGWASWVSSQLRDDPRHYAVAGGTFFWWDISRREIFNGARWQRPNPDASLLQSIDENEVSAVLWSLGRSLPAGPLSLYPPLASPRLTIAPFARCNTQLYRARDGGVCTSGEHAPHLADMLDALRCAGVDARTVGVAMGTYPYPVNAPRCEAGSREGCTDPRRCAMGSPMSLRANEIDDGEVALTLSQPGDIGAPTTVRLLLPEGVARVNGPTVWTVPAHSSDAARVSLRGARAGLVTVRFEAEAVSGWAGARATAQWTGHVPDGAIPLGAGGGRSVWVSPSATPAR